MNFLNIKTALLATSLVLGSLNASAANLVFDTTGEATFGNSFAYATQTSFTDTYSFTVDNGTLANLSFLYLTNSYTTNLADQFLRGVDVTSMTVGTLVGTETTDIRTIAKTKTKSDLWTLDGVLSAGNYVVTVEGITKGISSYNGVAQMSVSTVPEAETYSLMLVGLGFMGFVAGRRRSV